MEELAVRFDHSFRASQKFSSNGGGKSLRGSSTATPCWVRVPADLYTPNHPLRPAHPLPHCSAAKLGTRTSNATSPCVPGCYCSQPDVYQCDSDSSPGLTMTYVRGFDTDTDERVVRAFDTWGDTFTNNRTKWRSFPRGWPVNMTVRECTPPHPSATCALESRSYIQRHSSRSPHTLKMALATGAATHPRARHAEAVSLTCRAGNIQAKRRLVFGHRVVQRSYSGLPQRPGQEGLQCQPPAPALDRRSDQRGTVLLQPEERTC